MTPTQLGIPPDGKVIIELDRHLTDDEYRRLQAELQAGMQGDAQVVVLPPGVRLAANPAQLNRIEEKLDALLAALAEDAGQDDEEPARTLDGDLAGGERDQSMSLD